MEFILLIVAMHRITLLSSVFHPLGMFAILFVYTNTWFIAAFMLHVLVNRLALSFVK